MVSLQFRKMKTNQNSFLIIKVASSEPRQDENRFRGMSGVSASICGKKPFLGCLARLLAAGVLPLFRRCKQRVLPAVTHRRWEPAL
jgi:hypothetical protein